MIAILARLFRNPFRKIPPKSEKGDGTIDWDSPLQIGEIINVRKKAIIIRVEQDFPKGPFCYKGRFKWIDQEAIRDEDMT